jgi:hypothetical protein
MPARNPEAIRERAIAAAHQRTGQPATPGLDPVFVALNPGALPTPWGAETRTPPLNCGFVAARDSVP